METYFRACIIVVSILLAFDFSKEKEWFYLGLNVIVIIFNIVYLIFL
jgi:hypothetical protein